MPLDAVEALLSKETFVALGTSNTVAVQEAHALPEAAGVVRSMIREIDEVCSRFRPDSELSRLNRSAGAAAVRLSPLLEEAVVAGLRAAEMTGGLVDLTVGRALIDAGYDVTFRDMPADGPALQVQVAAPVGWQALEHDAEAHTLRLPVGVSIDLGASGKAWAADKAAAAASARVGGSVLVDLGGDIAVCGPAPEGGWPVRVTADEDSPQGQDISIYDGGLATSGVTARRWRRGGVEVHHIIDPATGMPARTRWAMVTVAAATCLEANAAATAALIMGAPAIEWLSGLGLPARLVHVDGTVHHAGGWAVT